MRSFEEKFDEWWEENYGDFSGHTKQTKRNMRLAFEAGQESRQTEVDELKRDNKIMYEGVFSLQKKNEELQKKITELKEIINENNKHD